MARENDSLRYWKIFATVSQLTVGGIGIGTALGYLAYVRWGLHWSVCMVLFFAPIILSFKEIFRRTRQDSKDRSLLP